MVGVMRPDFDWPNGTELWTPIALPSSRYFDRKFRFNENLFGVARLRPGVTVEQANAFLQSAHCAGNRGGRSDRLWPKRRLGHVRHVTGRVCCRQPAQAACHSAGGCRYGFAHCVRQHRGSAAGAGHRQTTRSFHSDRPWRGQRAADTAGAAGKSGAGSGGVLLGLALAHFAIPLLLLLAPANLAGNLTVHMGGPVLLFVSVIGVLCVLLCGTVPAWHMTHSRWFQILQEGGRSGTSGRVRQRLRSVLVIGEIGLAMLLLVGAGLLLRSLAQVERLDTGFEPHGLMTAVFSLPPCLQNG